MPEHRTGRKRCSSALGRPIFRVSCMYYKNSSYGVRRTRRTKEQRLLPLTTGVHNSSTLVGYHEITGLSPIYHLLCGTLSPAGSPPRNLALNKTSNPLNFREGRYSIQVCPTPNDEIIFAFHYSLALGSTLVPHFRPSSRVETDPSILSLYSTLYTSRVRCHVPCMYVLFVCMYVYTHASPYITYICTVMRMKKRARLPDKRGSMHSF